MNLYMIIKKGNKGYQKQMEKLELKQYNENERYLRNSYNISYICKFARLNFGNVI